MKDLHGTGRGAVPGGASGNPFEGWTFDLGAKQIGEGAKQKSEFERGEIIELKGVQTPEALRTLLRVLENDPSENNRESAIKALGGHGGERVLTVLESIWHGQEFAKFGQGAAGTALKELGMYRDDQPVFNPAQLQRQFLGLFTSQTLERPQRGTAAHAEVLNLGMLAGEIPAFSPLEARRIRLDLKTHFDLEEAQKRFEKAGLETSIIADNVLKVSGDSWPGFGYKTPELSLGFWVKSGSQRHPELRIITADRLPASTGVSDWTSATRLLARLAAWSGGN